MHQKRDGQPGRNLRESFAKANALATQEGRECQRVSRLATRRQEVLAGLVKALGNELFGCVPLSRILLDRFDCDHKVVSFSNSDLG